MTQTFQTIDRATLTHVTGGQKKESAEQQPPPSQFAAMLEQSVRGIVAEMLQSMSGAAQPGAESQQGQAPAQGPAPQKPKKK